VGEHLGPVQEHHTFLVHFHYHVLSSAITDRFDFTGGSVGNFFFAGARVFFRSMGAAVFLYSRVSGIPPETRVLPAVIAEDRLDSSPRGRNVGGDHGAAVALPPVTDYVTHVLYPSGGEVEIDADALDALCRSRSRSSRSSPKSRRSTRLHPDVHHPHHVRVVEVESVPADVPEEGGAAGSGGKSHHRVFEPRALVQEARVRVGPGAVGADFSGDVHFEDPRAKLAMARDTEGTQADWVLSAKRPLYKSTCTLCFVFVKYKCKEWIMAETPKI